MTAKIPVGGTIARAYGFAFGNIVNNLGTIWIPVAILYGLTYFFQGRYLQAVLDMGSHNPQAVMAAMPFMFAAMIVVVLLLTAQFAGLTKEALGLRTGSAFLQFPFGPAMWRLLGSWVLYGLVMIVIYIGFILINMVLLATMAGVAHGGSGAGAAAVGLVTLVLMLAALCAFIYISVRLSFLIAPVVVAERKVSLVRAWELTKGNFWRIFVINVVLFTPLIILECVYIYYLYGPSFLPPMGAHVTPDQITAWAQHQQEVSRLAMEKSSRYWFISYPVGLLVGLVFYGLFSGASAFAYRAVTQTDAASETF